MVTIPDKEVSPIESELLDQIFYYGQNDFAVGPEKNTTCSVSAGDVIELGVVGQGGKYIMVRMAGFGEITPEEFAEHRAMDRQDRTFNRFVF